MSGKPWEFAKNIATLLVSISLCVAAAEIAIRIAPQDRPKPIEVEGRIRHSDYMTHDSLLGWKPKPGAEGILATPEYQTRISINAKGFRGPEVPYDKAENEHRILVLGDSFAEGYTVDLEQRFSDLLEDRLDAAAESPIRVINLGVAGYSNDQELLLFRHEGMKYQPDTVILLVYDNDILYNARNIYWRGHKPQFELAGTGLRLTNTPVPKAEPRSETPSAPQDVEVRRTRVQAVKAWLNGNSKLYRFARRAVRDNYYLLSFGVAIGLTARDSLPDVPEEFRIYAGAYDAQTAYAWRMTERIIQELADDVAKAGADLLVAYAPSRAAVYSEDWTKTRWTYGMSRDEWNVHRVAAELTSICERSAIPFLDLTSALRTAAADLRRENGRVYFEHDSHWTPEGNAQVALALARFLGDRL